MNRLALTALLVASLSLGCGSHPDGTAGPLTEADTLSSLGSSDAASDAFSDASSGDAGAEEISKDAQIEASACTAFETFCSGSTLLLCQGDGTTATVVSICGPGQQCDAELALCVDESCKTDCTNRVCGDDGCGGSCGSCDEGDSCTSQGTCEFAGLSCEGVRTCWAKCSSTSCTTACLASATPAAAIKFGSWISCHDECVAETASSSSMALFQCRAEKCAGLMAECVVDNPNTTTASCMEISACQNDGGLSSCTIGAPLASAERNLAVQECQLGCKQVHPDDTELRRECYLQQCTPWLSECRNEGLYGDASCSDTYACLAACSDNPCDCLVSATPEVALSIEKFWVCIHTACIDSSNNDICKQDVASGGECNVHLCN